MSYVDPWNKKLAKASAKFKEGEIVWFQRDAYFDEEFADQIPKWHIFADRTPGDLEGVYIWKAICGYKRTFREILLVLPNLKLSGAPKVADRCAKCTEKRKKMIQAASVTTHHVNTKVGTAMTDQPVFTGTPDDWWEQAERIMESEAANRSLGNWYITQVRTAGQTKPAYRIMTPSKPANTDLVIAAQGPHNKESERVRLLIRGAAETPAWMDSVIVVADTVVDGEVVRLPWVRKRSGRWQSMYDGRLNINDHAMAELSPNPATITEDLI